MIDNDGDHSYNTVSQTVDFTAPGLYAVNLISFEDGGVTGVLWSSTIGGVFGRIGGGSRVRSVPNRGRPRAEQFVSARSRCVVPGDRRCQAG